MTMTHRETQATLRVLEKLICVAEELGIGDRKQSAALDALKVRRTDLRRIVAVRQEMRQAPVIHLDAWREASKRIAAA